MIRNSSAPKKIIGLLEGSLGAKDCGLDYRRKRLARVGLSRIWYVIQKAVNQSNVMNSLTRTGIYDATTGSINLKKMIDNLTLGLSALETLDTINVVPKLSRIVLANGEITDDELIELRILSHPQNLA